MLVSHIDEHALHCQILVDPLSATLPSITTHFDTSERSAKY